MTGQRARVEPMGVIEALKRTVELVASSQSSAWAHEDVQGIVEELRAIIAVLVASGTVEAGRLRVLFGPTGAIQETALDNGWGQEFLVLAQAVDEFLADEGRGKR